MIHITSNSSPIFDTVNTKIQTTSDASMSRSKIIQLYTSMPQVATKPSAPSPVFYFKHPFNTNNTQGRQPISLGHQFPTRGAILPPNFGNRPSPRPSFTSPNPVPNRVSFQPPPYTSPQPRYHQIQEPSSLPQQEHAMFLSPQPLPMQTAPTNTDAAKY